MTLVTRTVALPDGERVPALGLGTWQLGEQRSRRNEEIAALRLGLDLGARLIDTAEMYGEGRSETLIAEVIRGRRDEVFIVSKVYPHNATRSGTVAACERSLRRLGCEALDLYLLHWRGNVPLEETMDAFARLKASGKIRHYGVSNFDPADLEELWQIPEGRAIATNQVLYNLKRRAVEINVLPWLRRHHIPVMAYSPLEQAQLADDPKLLQFARHYGITAAQAAIGWLLAKDNVVAIPRTSSLERMRENLATLEHPLTPSQVMELDALFPRPARAGLLEMH
jgi:diketogulonate reductase-like aldo/keto reductase